MNEKITLPSLITLLANRSGKPKKQCEDFLREFFNTIVDTLESGDSVKVKGLGTFKVTTVMERKSVDVNTGREIEIPRHAKLSFVPTKELAEEINAPFAIFESIEIPDDIEDESEIENIQEETETSEAAVSTVMTNISGTEEIRVTENVDFIETKDASPTIYHEANSYENPPEEEEEVTETFYENKKSYRFILGFACGVACSAIICLIAYIFMFEKWSELFTSEKESIATILSKNRIQSEHNIVSEANKGESANHTDVATSDTSKDTEDIAPTRPSDEVVYDTISKTRYLTTMAKEHYGNFNLWPYIYEENKAILGHPDRIRPGTQVVIPSLSKYGINPSDPSDIKKAKQKGIEIYSCYK